MARKIKVDMTDVESFVRCEEGEHIVVLKSVEEGVSGNGNDKLNVKFEVVKGSSEGATILDNFTLTENALWKLKGWLEAVGMKSEGRIVIDLDAMVGKKCIAVVTHEEYNGQVRAKVESFKKIGSAKAQEPDEDEIEDEEEEDEVPAPKKSKSKPAPAPATKSKKKPAPVEEEEDEEEEEEEEAPPAKKKKAAAPPAKPAKKPAKKKPVDDDEDEDEDWEED